MRCGWRPWLLVVTGSRTRFSRSGRVPITSSARATWWSEWLRGRRTCPARWPWPDGSSRKASPSLRRSLTRALVGGAKVSLWEHIDADGRRPIDFQQLGEVVARFHRLAPARLSGVMALPFCGDVAWLAVEQNLALAEAANVVDAEGLAALRRASVALRGWHDRARQEAPVVCHGDVHPKNVLMRGDDVVIIDWDAICTGPPAWDIPRLRARIRRRPARIAACPGTGCPASARPDDQHDHRRREQPRPCRRGQGSDAVLDRRSRRSSLDAPLSEPGAPAGSLRPS
jgi:hypothetical protein